MTDNKSEANTKAVTRRALKLADVEYRIQWNEEQRGWDVLRNGSKTATSARKKFRSAIDTAIRDAKAELEMSKVTTVVTCLRDRKLETKWKGPRRASG